VRGAALKAGVVYFVLTFSIAFFLGGLRVFFVVPRLGETAAAALETPLVLAASWVICGGVLRRFAVDPSVGSRLCVGAVAFALTIVAELAVSTFLFGRDLPAFLAVYATPSGQIGIAGQLAFAVMPLMRGSGRR